MFFEIEFPTAVIGRQAVDLVVTEDSFRRELSAARTFGFIEAGRGPAPGRPGPRRVAGKTATCIIDDGATLNPEGLRFPDEFVRHKALDAVGDLYVLGMPMLGRFEGRKAGHGLNNAVVRAPPGPSVGLAGGHLRTRDGRGRLEDCPLAAMV